MEIAVLVLFIVVGLTVIGVCIMCTLNFLGIQSIKNDLDSFKKKTRLLEQASGIGDVSQVLNEINVEREKIDNLQLFIDETVMNQIQDNTTQATKANDDLGIFQNSSRDDAGASTTIGSIGEPGAAEVLETCVLNILFEIYTAALIAMASRRASGHDELPRSRREGRPRS